MPFGYPVMLEVADRRCVVIGTLAVHEGKAEGLVAAGADDVLVLAETPDLRLRDLERLQGVRVQRRAWEPSDLDGAFLVVASSVDASERDRIATEARARGALVNVMDDIPNCDWSAPSVVRRGELVLTIATGGASPALAKQLRQRTEAAFGEEWAEVLAILRRVRAETMPSLPDFALRAARWSEALDPGEAAEMVRGGRGDEWAAILRGRLLGEPSPAPSREREPAAEGRPGGRVILVGAGPGDARLLTLAGADALAGADVVVYDRLAAPSLLDLAPAGAERVYAGKEPGRLAMTQPEIDRVLVDRASRGATVVRLKGGDPFVFGRGGEELLACRAAGVPCEVVPGVTSAVAAPAAAGIPLTHREVARSFAVVTGTTAHAEDTPDLAAIATATDTLVILMAAGRLAETCEALVEGGRPPEEPAAIVQWAWTPDQRTVTGTLATLPGLATAAAIGPPATLVIGEVAKLARTSPDAAHERTLGGLATSARVPM
jgi:uroporphyrin-III C-methyltransferase/precorrin-2 dehydrogenase/sirohydrochlorin ferrochelatase